MTRPYKILTDAALLLDLRVAGEWREWRDFVAADFFEGEFRGVFDDEILMEIDRDRETTKELD